MSEISILELLRTGNMTHNSKPVFSAWIVQAVNNAVGNDLPHSESYWLTLETMRPDIADALYHSQFDPFSASRDEFNLTNFVAEVYKRW